MKPIEEFKKLKDRLEQKHHIWEAENIIVGDFTYGIPTICQWNEGTTLRIGKFCSIAGNVTIMLGGNHRTDWCSTYPFNALLKENYGYIKGHPSSKGDVTIGNDVWIASGVKIMSGVTIGDGAVLAANALITHDVAPYEIVGGVPAKHIKYRFSEHTIEQLEKIKWWDWEKKKILDVIPFLQSNDIKSLLTYASLTIQ